MHDIWNPWHGCRKCSEGCENCYMYFLDRMRDQDGSHIYKTKNGFRYPLSRDRHGAYKVKSGEQLRVCMTSDFFLPEADEWRREAWAIMAAPFIGPIDIEKYLSEGQIEQVICGGENYDGSRPCHYEWVKSLSDQCRSHNVTFNFIETGTIFIKDGKRYHIPDKKVQAQQAFRSGLSFKGKDMVWRLHDRFGRELTKEELYTPHFHPVTCRECGSRLTCNGCADCGRCGSHEP